LTAAAGSVVGFAKMPRFANRFRPALLLWLLPALALIGGCSKPQLDTSGPTQFRSSVAEVRDQLPADARAEFDAALSALVTGDANGDPDSDLDADSGSDSDANSRRNARRAPLPAFDAISPALRTQLQGRTGRQVIAIAKEQAEAREARRRRAEALARERERRQLRQALSTLHSQLDRLDLATLKGFAVVRSQLLLPTRPEADTNVVKDWFDAGDLARSQARSSVPGPTPEQQPALPEIELQVESLVRDGVYAALLEIALVDIETLEPHYRFQTLQRFANGLFYGETASRRFVPEAFTELFGSAAYDGPAPDPQRLLLVVKPLRLLGIDDKPLADASELSDQALQDAQTLLAQLRQNLETTAAAGKGKDDETTVIESAAMQAASGSAAAADLAMAAEVEAILAWRKAAVARAAWAEVEAIRAEQRSAEAARAPFYRFRLEQPRFYWSDSKVHRKPVIELRVRNDTGELIHWFHCRGRLRSPERERPWVDAPIKHQLRGGLAPGESRELRILPNWLGPWGAGPKDQADLRLELSLTELIGDDRQTLFSDRFPQQKRERLEQLEALIASHGW
jgi:hypothetical protein